MGLEIMTYRSNWIVAILLACALPTAAAQEGPTFPNKPIRLVVTTAPGTGSDAIARLIENGMQQALGQPVVVDNRPGAGGALGMELVAHAPPDGHTIVMGAEGTTMVLPAINPNAKYHTEVDFMPVAGLFRTAFVIVTANAPTAPKTLLELIDRAKKENLSYGSSGVGTITHLASEMFIGRAGIKLTHVPYKGAGQSLTDTIAGHVAMVTDTPPAVLPLVRSGKLRALAILSAERLSSMPDVPTVQELGFPGLVAAGTWGLLAPAGTPATVVKKLSDAAIKALQAPEVKSKAQAMELEIMSLGPDAYGSYMKTYTPVWTEVIKKGNIRVD
ncbi:MAG: tripartite tricarboxylate transporter substrate binding protein [Ottowia sp.]|uniref:Bug family tripartite tricarboxylate transporter substrate binding protein n=1 Tax=Ottowia sp. TaxID=1898956 RepID=UPI0039E35A34